MDKIELVNFSDEDAIYKLLYKWCSNKFVYEWFEQRILSYDEIVKKYKKKLLDGKQKLFLINYNNKPIGLVQIYKYDDLILDELKKYKEIDYKIDVVKEQNKMLKADIIVLQYPLFWYSMPSLLEKWMEEVFRHGFSHGTKGNKLKDKKVIVSITTGAPEEVYNNIDDFLNPIKSSCKLCQMEYVGNIVTYGVSYQLRNEKSKEIENKAINHADRLIELLEKQK